MASAKYNKEDAKSVARELLKGLIPGPILPITEDGQIDEAGFRHNVRYAIDVAGSEVLYINSYYQNFWLLTSDERKRIIEIAVDEVAGEVPLINRCAHPSPKEAIDLALHAQSLGVDFISLVLPPFGSNKDILFGYFSMIAREIELGITIFNTAQAGYSISPEWMAELAEIPNIASLKNGMELEHTAKIRELVGDSIVVVDPDEENFLENLKAGQQAIFSGTPLMFDTARAKPMRDYAEAGFAGDMEKATELFEAVQPIRDTHHKWVLGPWGNAQGLCPVSAVHEWMSLLGMKGGQVPEPLPNLTEEERAQMRTDLAAVGLID